MLDAAIRTALDFRRHKHSKAHPLQEVDGPDGLPWAVEQVGMKVRRTVGGTMQSTFNFSSERDSTDSAVCFLPSQHFICRVYTLQSVMRAWQF